MLSGRVAADLAAMRPGALRNFANEDVTVGSWMLAMNVRHLWGACGAQMAYGVMVVRCCICCPGS